MTACSWERTFAAAVAGALLSAACVSGDDPVPVAATFRGLGFLPGYATSQAIGASSDGTVVVGAVSTIAGQRQAFRWNANQGLVGLGFLPGGTSSIATSVSADGAVIVGSGDATNGDPPTPSAAFRWTGAGMQRLESLPGSALCHAAGVSGDGVIVSGACLQINNTAFRWTASSGALALTRFGGGSNQQSAAVAISRDGNVIAGVGHPSLTGAVIWSADGTPTILGKLPGDASAVATAASTDGSVVVGSSTDSTGKSRAFRWTPSSGMVAIDDGVEGLLTSSASSVSGDGRIVVGWGNTPNGEVALVWDAEHGLRRLDAALLADQETRIDGWTLARATAISDDGRTITGYGTNPQGATEAWIVELPNR